MLIYGEQNEEQQFKQIRLIERITRRIDEWRFIKKHATAQRQQLGNEWEQFSERRALWNERRLKIIKRLIVKRWFAFKH